MLLIEFDECYEEQDFYENLNPKKIDFTLLEGVNGYCDDEAKKYVLDVLDKNQDSLAFWGNGNYHYMSYLALQKIKQDFSLCVFDHHPDMQPSFFEELLSCGCWIKHALENLTHLKNVLVLGVKKELLEELSETEGFTFLGLEQGIYQYEKDGKHIMCIEESFFVGSPWKNQEWCGKVENIFRERLSFPVYLSIDKDVLSEQDCITNWDAGSMRLETMMQLLHLLAKSQEIIAMDVCGEWDGMGSMVTESFAEIVSKNNRCNEEISKWWLEIASKKDNK